MMLAAKEKFVLIMAVFIWEIIKALESDVTNIASKPRERRAMLFPSGTVLQVRSDTLFS
jgi:hypothetical protein